PSPLDAPTTTVRMVRPSSGCADADVRGRALPRSGSVRDPDLIPPGLGHEVPEGNVRGPLGRVQPLHLLGGDVGEGRVVEPDVGEAGVELLREVVVGVLADVREAALAPGGEVGVDL